LETACDKLEACPGQRRREQQNETIWMQCSIFGPASDAQLERVPDNSGLRMEDSIVEVLPSND
jgi:hypothetical protein